MTKTTKKPGPDWSKVGRRCRRKGKTYECEVARDLRRVTGFDWQSTRNSGRTDLRGDLYCLNRNDYAVIECKHRADFCPRDWLLGNQGYVREMASVFETFRSTGQKKLVVFAKVSLLGTFVAVWDDGQWRHLPADNGLDALDRQVVAADGVRWHLLPKEDLLHHDLLEIVIK